MIIKDYITTKSKNQKKKKCEVKKKREDMSTFNKESLEDETSRPFECEWSSKNRIPVICSLCPLNFEIPL